MIGRGLTAFAAVGAVLWAAAGDPAPPGSPAGEGPSTPASSPAPEERERGPRAPSGADGVCWVGSADPDGLASLAGSGVRWISVSPFAYGQSDPHRPPEGGFRASRFRGESLEGIRAVVRAAHSAGLRVLVKPHIWLHGAGAWRGDIAMRSDADWDTWFAAYEAFLAPFVELAREESVAALCIGCELGGTVEREARWRALLERVRGRYDGSITYAANWHGEVESVPFWDALDWIGVQAYFPLTETPTPTEQDLRAGWEPWKRMLEALSRRHGRTVVLTEVGYRPETDNGREPWRWHLEGPLDPDAQARAFRALFAAFEEAPWLEGIQVWKWFAHTPAGERPRRQAHDGFSPQGLPAEAVILEAFRMREAARARDGESSDPSLRGETDHDTEPQMDRTVRDE